MRQWIIKEPQTLDGCILVVLFVFSLDLTWMVLTIPFITPLIDATNDQTVRTAAEFHPFYLLFFAAFFEEIIFRVLPLFFCVILFLRKSTIIWIAFVSSAIFGFEHGSWVHILMQGEAGFVYCLAYLKCGGWRGAILKPLSVTTSAHVAWNMMIFYLLLPLAV